ncbi:MAG: response regulator transcription factor [Solirubrobacteraceae bacterium]|nr:response regulator transcription factor [Solirubrobacteraceae bacterium]
MAGVTPAEDPSDDRGGPPDAGRPIRVLVVDDDPLVRSALSMMLDGADGLRVVGEAEDGDEVSAAVREHRPDVVLMDIRMPRVDGLRATRELRSRTDGPVPEVIVLTTLDVDGQVVDALRGGAAGFLLKDTPPADIVRAIRLVAAGEAMLSPAVTRRLVDHVADGPADDRRRAARARLAELTDREREVADALRHGKANADIAAELFMSVATVKAHVSRVMQKLDLDNRVQVALLVHDAGDGQ